MAKLKDIIKLNNIEMSQYDIFIETGLYVGETLTHLNSENHFENIKKVYSIEIEPHFVNQANKNLKFLKEEKYEVILGDSSIELNSLVKKHKDEKIFIWLDAHFSGGNTGKSKEFGECPVLGELNFIEKLNVKPTIAIDDIGLFLNFPERHKKNHKREDWPLIGDIEKKLKDSKFNFEIKLGSSCPGVKELQYLIAK